MFLPLDGENKSGYIIAYFFDPCRFGVNKKNAGTPTPKCYSGYGKASVS
jgi:hypothetical protein